MYSDIHPKQFDDIINQRHSVQQLHSTSGGLPAQSVVSSSKAVFFKLQMEESTSPKKLFPDI